MNLKKRLYYPYIGLWYSVTSHLPVGTNIYALDWDVAIILDTCRVDALRELKSEYGFITDVDSIWSVGSSTPEWLVNTFSADWRDQVKRTTRLSANGFDEYILVNGSQPPELDKAPFASTAFSLTDHSEFDHLEIMYQGGLHSEELGTVPPSHVTKRGIAIGRHQEWDRMMIHYVQPHAPYITRALNTESSITDIESRPMWALRNGLISRETGWQMYLDNLRLALDEVEKLVSNLTAQTVVITADHGESFGEYGGKFGHIDGYLTPQVRKVPWVEMSATDEETVTPEAKYEEDQGIRVNAAGTDELKDHLKDLGYF
jgi:hypothetical protein